MQAQLAEQVGVEAKMDLADLVPGPPSLEAGYLAEGHGCLVAQRLERFRGSQPAVGHLQVGSSEGRRESPVLALAAGSQNACRGIRPLHFCIQTPRSDNQEWLRIEVGCLTRARKKVQRVLRAFHALHLPPHLRPLSRTCLLAKSKPIQVAQQVPCRNLD